MEQQEHVNLTIDGRPVSVPKGTLLWAAAQQLGIEIPIYCYHPKMDPLGACRMCFVELKGQGKPFTACTTVVSEGMEVFTSSPMATKARQGTLEFLLINHPLDCPICDKGGECDLQDFTLRYGPGDSRFDLSKRHFPKPIPVSEHILLDRERCITCHRCVRFCQDIAQEPGLVMKSRGFKTEVGVDEAAPFDSIFSGNVVEMCPVGALTAKSYRFVTRPWELKRTDSVCGLCAVGCNVRVDVRVNKALRQYSRTNDDIDDGWLCDRGRWQLDRINSADRLTAPLVRRDGTLQPATWDEAISAVAQGIRTLIAQHGASAFGGIGSTQTTNEESYLFQKLLRQLGTNNVDHRHSALTSRSPDGTPWVWDGSIAGLEKASHIVLLGTDIYHRQPVIELRIRRALRRGAKVYLLSPDAQRLDRLATASLRYQVGQTGLVARALLAALSREGVARGAWAEAHAADLRQTLTQATQAAAMAGLDTSAFDTLVNELAQASALTVLYDERATSEPSGATLADDVRHIALVTGQYGRPGASSGPLFAEANSLGARDMGLLPDVLPGYLPAVTAGQSAEQMLAGDVKGLWVLGASITEPAHLAALAQLDFLVVQDLFLTEAAKRATVVLPAASFAEKDGTMTNTERCVQVVRQALPPVPGSHTDWDILTAVARAMKLGWSYLTPADTLREITREVPFYAGASRRSLGQSGARWPLVSGAEGLIGTPFLPAEIVERGPGVLATATQKGGAA
ncbi:MAG TPA: NADH-quinone oxidoreductase subunit NuoG [Ktedonobacterales bacterium]